MDSKRFISKDLIQFLEVSLTILAATGIINHHGSFYMKLVIHEQKI